MTKTSMKGRLGKVLACGCSLALAASLAPAAGLQAWGATEGLQGVLDKIHITVQAKTASDSTTILSETDLYRDVIDSISSTAGTGGSKSLYWTGTKWGVVNASNGITVKTLLNQAKVSGQNVGTYLDNYPSAEVTFSSGYKKTLENGYVIPTTGIDNIQPYTATWSQLTQAKNFYDDTTAKDLKTTTVTPAAGDTVTLPSLSTYDSATFAPIPDPYGTSGAVVTPKASEVTTGTTVANSGYTLLLGLSSDDALNGDAKAAAAKANFVQGVNNITVTLPYAPYDNTKRVAGTEWADTMYDSVMATFGSNTKTKNIVVTTSVSYHDALAVSGFAGQLGGSGAPILMTDQATLTPQTKKLITLLTSGLEATDNLNIYVIGGPNAVSDAVLNEISSMPVFTKAPDDASVARKVTRIYGNEAWDTSLEIFKASVASWSTDANKGPIICTSKSYMDALSIAPYAYASKRPIILTNESNVLTADAKNIVTTYYKDKGATTPGAVICGGPNAVSYSVQVQLADLGQKNMTRFSGYEWDETSNMIATALYNGTLEGGASTFGKGATAVGIATADDYYDALSATAYCAKATTPGMPIVLVSSKQDNTYTISHFIAEHSATAKPAGQLTNGVIFGGTGIIPDDIQLLAENALN